MSDPDPNSAAALAAQFRATWRQSVDGILDACELVAKASRMGLLQELVSQLPEFHPATLRKLSRIGEITWLRPFADKLPPAWGTLYEISKLDEPAFHNAIGNGTITPEAERQQITAFRTAMKGSASTASTSTSTSASLDKAIGVLDRLRIEAPPRTHAALMRTSAASLQLVISFLQAVLTERGALKRNTTP